MKESIESRARAKWIERHTVGGITPHDGAIQCWEEGFEDCLAALEAEYDLVEKIGRTGDLQVRIFREKP